MRSTTIRQVPLCRVIYGVSIIRGLIDDPAVLDIVAHHHERYDGRGYPYGVAGAQTSLLARIVQVADAVSAMTLDRPYRRGLPPEHVIAELRRGAARGYSSIPRWSSPSSPSSRPATASSLP